MYSDNPTGPEPYTYTFAQGGSTATAEGQGWNKEHSFPNSWFSASSSTANFPGADLFHLYPTDIRVNSLRGNLPYGRVATAATTTLNGSKIGSSAIAFPGYSGQVFEPIDTYKGDLARAALYMVTRYQADQASWENLQPTGDVLMDGTTYPSVEIEYLKMLIQWHNQDPVSTKELDRNNTVYGFQGNRNPFIDHPEYVGQIWSTACGLALPINLNYFNAKLMENNIQLNWNADNAVGFSHFIIERSVDGINFSKIGQVKGTSNNNYAFTDKDFPNGKGIYYKLKMVDNDGAFKNSAIVFVKLNNNFSNALVYPNPTLGPLYIKLNEALYTNSTLQVSDVTGRILKQQTVNSFTRNINLDVKELSAGRYFIKISNSTQIINQSFVVMK
jgi:endonuclease I